MKTLTREQLEGRKEKAVRFSRDVLGDSDRAEEIADENLEDYADRRNIQILPNPSVGNMTRVRLVNPVRASNPQRRMMQANPAESGRAELLARIRELQRENDQLQDRLDKVAKFASAPKDGRDESQDELIDALNNILDLIETSNEEDDPGNE